MAKEINAEWLLLRLIYQGQFEALRKHAFWIYAWLLRLQRTDSGEIPMSQLNWPASCESPSVLFVGVRPNWSKTACSSGIIGPAGTTSKLLTSPAYERRPPPGILWSKR